MNSVLLTLSCVFTMNFHIQDNSRARQGLIYQQQGHRWPDIQRDIPNQRGPRLSWMFAGPLPQIAFHVNINSKKSFIQMLEMASKGQLHYMFRETGESNGEKNRQLYSIQGGSTKAPFTRGTTPKPKLNPEE